jgi:hypothetical protein
MLDWESSASVVGHMARARALAMAVLVLRGITTDKNGLNGQSQDAEQQSVQSDVVRCHPVA